MTVSVYQVSLYSTINKEYEQVDFLHIGVIDKIRRSHAILINFDTCPKVILQPEMTIKSAITKGSIRNISLLEAIKYVKGLHTAPATASVQLRALLDSMLSLYSFQQLCIKASIKIRVACELAYLSPNYAMCKRRIQREFQALITPI